MNCAHPNSETFSQPWTICGGVSFLMKLHAEETLAQVFYFEICENAFFTGHFLTTAFDYSSTNSTERKLAKKLTQENYNTGIKAYQCLPIWARSRSYKKGLSRRKIRFKQFFWKRSLKHNTVVHINVNWTERKHLLPRKSAP